MEELQNLTKELLDNLHDGVCLVDGDRAITYWSKGAERLTGHKAKEMIGRPCSDAFLPCLDSLIPRTCGSGSCPIEAGLEGTDSKNGECHVRHKDGHRIAVVTRTVTVKRPPGEAKRSIVVFNDNSRVIEARREMENLRRIALLDPITVTGTRRYSELSLQAKLDEMRRYSSSLGLLFIHVDNYERIAEIHGHEVGDRVLRTSAKTLLNSLRSSDLIGRWEREQFLAIVLHVDDETLLEVANRFRTLMHQSVVHEDKVELHFTASIGATMATEDDTMETLIDRVSGLMEASRAAGGNCATVEGPDREGLDSRLPFKPVVQ
jgi:diguanylate cyclase (GGDEF)-like protein/PAS domain S-box-containing protein